MENEGIVSKWFRRNWPLAVTGAILSVGVGVLLMRSTEYDQPPKVEAAVVVPGETVVVPGQATVIAPGEDAGAQPALVSDSW